MLAVLAMALFLPQDSGGEMKVIDCKSWDKAAQDGWHLWRLCVDWQETGSTIQISHTTA